MTDKELLELAAKATKQKILRDPYGQMRICENADPAMNIFAFPLWNPLTGDGDALRLAVKLNIVVWEFSQYNRAMAEVRYGHARGEYWELGDDPYAATRRAIVRAAAEIGKTL